MHELNRALKNTHPTPIRNNALELIWESICKQGATRELTCAHPRIILRGRK
jgi:hypothetical protein